MKSKKDKILYIGNYNNNSTNASSQRVINNCRCLHSIGYETIVIGYKDDCSDNDIEEITLKSGKVTLHNLKRDRKSNFSVRNILEIIELYSDSIKGIILYDYNSLKSIIINKYCIRRNIRTYVDLTEWYSSNQGNIPYRVLKFIDINVRMKLFAPKCDGIITVSKYLYNYYSKLMDNVIKVPPLSNVNKVTISSNTTKRIVYAGYPFNLKTHNIDSKKFKDRIDIIVDSTMNMIKKSIDVSLDIIGITAEEYLSKVPKHSEVSNYSNIKFHGVLDKEAVDQIYSKSDYVVLIRNHDRISKAGYSTKFVDAISNGLNVITNDNFEMYEVIDSLDRGTIISVDSMEDVANEIEKAVVSEEDIKIGEYVNPFFYMNYTEYFSELLSED